MPTRSVLLLLVAIAIAALAALNWSILATPTLISLGVTVVNAPLGLVMLALTALLAVFFVAYVLYLQTTVLMDARRHTKEMATQRDLADRAEASRFTELRTLLLQRIDALEAALSRRIDQADASTAAYVGELDSRLASDRRPPPAGTPPLV